EASAVRYQHDDLRASFDQLERGISQGVAAPAAVSQRLMFRRDDYWFISGLFPDELRAAGEVFLLLEREAETQAQDAATPPFDDIKLASPLRAEEVYTKALEGVPRKQLPSLGFSQIFGHRATVFQLDNTSREWQQAVTEGALCFAALPGLEDLSAAL